MIETPPPPRERISSGFSAVPVLHVGGRRRRLWVPGVALLSLAVLVTEVLAIRAGALNALDSQISARIVHLAGPNGSLAARGLAFVGRVALSDQIAPIFIIVITMVLWRRRLRWSAAFFLAAALGSAIIAFSLQTIFERPEPVLHDPHSFPSGHAADALAVYGALAVLVAIRVANRAIAFTISMIALILTLLVGFARIAEDVHDPSDVVGGYALGGLWLLCMVLAFMRRLQREEG